VNNPAGKNVEVAEEMTQQLTGNAVRESTEGRAQNTEMYVWMYVGTKVREQRHQLHNMK
jgi:hypothetical protein